LKSNLIWWVDRSGRRWQLGDPTTIANLDLSPDGRRIALDPFLSSALDIWLMDAATGARERVTFVPPGTFAYESPVWAPDGRRIAYAFQADHSMRVHALTLDGGKDELLFTRRHHHHLQDWSPDGTWLLLGDEHPERQSDMVAVQLAPGNREVAVAVTPAREQSGRFSPDGKWVAYQSDESGRDEVYVASFPSADRRRQVSTDGGRFPRWSRTGGELFYWRDSTLMAMRVSTTGSFGRADATPLFTMDDADPTYGRWDASADGQRFLIAGRNPGAPTREIHLVLNWNAILRKPGSPEP
jgi:Tol biopolymer transport system component